MCVQSFPRSPAFGYNASADLCSAREGSAYPDPRGERLLGGYRVGSRYVLVVHVATALSGACRYEDLLFADRAVEVLERHAQQHVSGWDSERVSE